jgi:5-methylcytosine-specific restriction endonuclease McrA
MAVWPYTTQRWQRLRRMKLCEHPLCEACLQVGRIEPAVAVDHRVPITEECRKRRSGEAYPALNELASLCARCHNAKTRGEQLGETNYWVKGCDVFGYPLDPSHPWNREKRNEKNG